MALLWEKYRSKTNGDGIGYTMFCEIIKQFQKDKNKVKFIKISAEVLIFTYYSIDGRSIKLF